MVKAFSPKTLSEALQIRKDHLVVPYNGGTDLMIAARKDVDYLYLHQIESLNRVEEDAEYIYIGAGCTFSAICSNEKVPKILRLAAGQIAAPAIRNFATIGGNICNASPAGDSLPVLFALHAGVKVQSLERTRIIPIDAFVLGVRKTDLKPDELVTQIIIPKVHFDKIRFEKVAARQAQAISKCVFCGLMQCDEDHITDVRFSFGAVFTKPVYSREIEKQIIGKKLSQIDIPFVLQEYESLIRPIDDQRSTAQYRKQVCLNLLKDFLSGSTCG